MPAAEMKHTKDFLFEVKKVSEEGKFTGVLSVYGVVDLGGDVVEPGAFTKTLQESGGRIPCLWKHRDEIGMLTVKDTGEALEVEGELCLDMRPDGQPAVPDAFKALALMRRGITHGMSIGYRTIKAQVLNGVRHLKELALAEGSVVTFPMLPVAQITSVKSTEGKAADFQSVFERSHVLTMRYMMISALEDALNNIAWDSTLTDQEKVDLSGTSITQFQTAYVDLMPAWCAAWNGKQAAALEQKAGRRLSADTLASMQEIMRMHREAMDKLQALMDEEDTTSKEAGPLESPEPSQHGQQEPAPDHSLLEEFKSTLTGVMQWN